MEPNALAQAVMKSLRGFVARSLAPVVKRMDQLETKSVALRDLTGEEKTALAESMLPYMREAHAKWALDFERSATELMLKAISNIPDPKDGKDGLSISDFDCEMIGRSLTIRLGDGEREVSKTFRLPVPMDRGVYKPDGAYEKGDAVTYGGSLWIAQSDGPGAPGKGDGWRLAVKRGRDAERAD